MLAAIAAISLLVGGIGIMNIMLAERDAADRGIGMRRRSGDAPGDYRAVSMIEAVVMTVSAV